ncbi:MAG: hypothetical protein ISP97_04820 [Luminiphilus sp.]|nr:hypothetical protein [Luminiphilus sp.]
MTIRIAMWSGPRNISTAMMRAWENRPDCTVIDEPFYACYLAESGADHPCREQVLASQPTQRREVIAQLERAAETPLQYEKHMTHHMPFGCDLGWAASCRHAFLIRSPGSVIASYLKKRSTVSEEDIGITRQRALFEEITAITGKRPPVVDAGEVLANPASMMSKLCEALDVPVEVPAMTAWPAGLRDSDGVWASHWYHAVETSTGFSKPTASRELEDESAIELANSMQEHYQALYRYRLT